MYVCYVYVCKYLKMYVCIIIKGMAGCPDDVLQMPLVELREGQGLVPRVGHRGIDARIRGRGRV